MDLLAKTRKINRLLQRASHYVDFQEVAELLSDVIGAHVYVVSRSGKILGQALVAEHVSAAVSRDALGQKAFPSEYNAGLLRHDATASNLPNEDPLSALAWDSEPEGAKYSTIVPIVGGGERLGTLVLARADREFNEEDLLLGEYGATVVGMEILRARTHEIEEETRAKAVVQMAIDSLSFSELEAVDHIFAELEGKEGLLVASKIADRVGITRSVIVNALRKLESAGVIESRSLGMKGTYIKVLNGKLISQLDKARGR